MDRFEITKSVVIVTRPRGDDWLQDDLVRLRTGGIDLLISCLTSGEEAELGLEREADEARAAGLEYVRLSIEDRTTPQPAVVQKVVETLAPRIRTGTRVAVHCRQGLGRAPLIAGALLVGLGSSAEDAWERIERARGRPVPDTPEQRAWLRQFAIRLGL